jgi:hypothetical protein
MRHDCLSTGARITLIDCEIDEGFLHFAWGLILPGKKPSKMAITNPDNNNTCEVLVPPTWQNNKDIISLYNGTIEIYEQRKAKT